MKPSQLAKWIFVAALVIVGVGVCINEYVSDIGRKADTRIVAAEKMRDDTSDEIRKLRLNQSHLESSAREANKLALAAKRESTETREKLIALGEAKIRAEFQLEKLHEMQTAIESEALKIKEKADKDRKLAEAIRLDVKKYLGSVGASPETAELLAKEESDEQRRIGMQPLGLKHLDTDNRPKNGDIFKDNIIQHQGKGQLTVDNGQKEDAHVKLIYRNGLALSFYVRGGSKFTYQSIPDGTYTIMFCTGYGWQQGKDDFDRGREARKFDNTDNYLTRTKNLIGSTTTYTDVHTITLHPVAGGTATTTGIPLSEFDKY